MIAIYFSDTGDIISVAQVASTTDAYSNEYSLMFVRERKEWMVHGRLTLPLKDYTVVEDKLVHLLTNEIITPEVVKPKDLNVSPPAPVIVPVSIAKAEPIDRPIGVHPIEENLRKINVILSNMESSLQTLEAKDTARATELQNLKLEKDALDVRVARLEGVTP